VPRRDAFERLAPPGALGHGLQRLDQLEHHAVIRPDERIDLQLALGERLKRELAGVMNHAELMERYPQRAGLARGLALRCGACSRLRHRPEPGALHGIEHPAELCLGAVGGARPARFAEQHGAIIILDQAERLLRHLHLADHRAAALLRGIVNHFLDGLGHHFSPENSASSRSVSARNAGSVSRKCSARRTPWRTVVWSRSPILRPSVVALMPLRTPVQ